ncbi:MAG: bifunctional oligoribonuclease/PAP phosphatase NrnA [Candidatus Omnitrophica bacterium]|nr:bifunctional oligoribonuclease/PAP phosphatase NrnA [Candidatus Omnitrophota bacterium]
MVMNKDNMKNVIRQLKKRDNFLVMAHVNPEGDSIGSQIAMQRLLEKWGKKAVVVDHDEVPDNLRFLKGAEAIQPEVPAGFSPETLVILDCPVRERTGDIPRLGEEKGFIINIDHHVSNEYFGDANWVEAGASSVGEMIYILARETNTEIDIEIAEAIYTAIITDTGMFNYTNTTRHTHEVAGELIEVGVDPKGLHGRIFESKELSQIRLLGKVLGTLQVEDNGRLAHMSLTRSMLAEEGVDSVPTDEFINYPRSIKGVQAAVFFKENMDHPERINVSFRSTGGIDVNKVASRFGGGGHPQASGCTLFTNLREAREKVLNAVKEVIDRG